MLLLLAFIILMLAIGVPLFTVIGIAASIAFAVFAGKTTLEDQEVLIVKMVGLTEKNVFLAIPFFVVSGAIMTAGDIAKRLVELAEALVGWMRGGLAIAAVVACMVFASISGSSPVTLIAIGGIMYPALRRAGYRDDFSVGLLATAGSLGCLLPPSLPMLVYSISVTGGAAVDIRDLFIAGYGPALLIGGLLAVYSFFRAGPVAAGQSFSAARLKTTFARGIWALALPIFVVGGIRFGFFTPTEASALSVVYAVIVEVFIHRSLTLAQLPDVVLKATTSMGGLLLIILLSFAINDFMVESQVAELVLEKVREWGLSAVTFMLIINVFLVITGMFMDSISAIVLFTPLIAPAAVALGIDPLHLGVVFIVNMEVGYLAPPIATNLFVASSIFRKDFGMVCRAVLPTLGILCVGLVLVTYVPTLSIGPVRALRGESFYVPFTKPAEAEPEIPDPIATPSPENRVMSIQEMMEAAKRRQQEGAASPTPEASATPKVMSIQEMMEEAKRRREAEASANPAPAP